MANNKGNSLIFYMFELNTSCRAVYILIEELNIEATIQKIDMRKGEHLTDDFKQISPLGQLPVMIDNGLKLSESSAILCYLVEQYGNEEQQNKLMGINDIKIRAKIQMALYFNVSRFYKPVADWLRPQIFRGSRPTEGECLKLKEALRQLNSLIKSYSKYVAGSDEPTVADIALFSSVSFLQVLNYNLLQYNSLWNWLKRLKKSSLELPIGKSLISLQEWQEELNAKSNENDC
ncbi:DgyrCDS12442 [Dimorphilus gyrociliatus]|uniref:DgyrCDS12442 n=1 Tax=Dimorphilus gyrociliatus TaxID=2664684 RepID=A0A7I8W6I3_9ANNE|nr:DgyrCDS12442 [Dimorphilus gyrociliatus]